MGVSKRTYSPEFRMLVAKTVVCDGMTTIDAGKLFKIHQQLAHDWAAKYVEYGSPDFITGNKTEMEVERDKLLWKSATLAYRSAQYRKDAEVITKQIEKEQASKKIQSDGTR